MRIIKGIGYILLIPVAVALCWGGMILFGVVGMFAVEVIKWVVIPSVVLFFIASGIVAIVRKLISRRDG